MAEVRFICENCNVRMTMKEAQDHKCQEETLTDGMQVPDIIGEVEAWRAWKLMGDPAAGDVRLHSVTHGQHFWPHDEWTHAACLTCESIPGEHHTCGLYAANSRDHLLGMNYGVYSELDEPVAIGKVYLAGRVVIGSQGYRAEKARIKQLLIPYEFWKWVKPTQEQYKHSEVSMDNWLKEAK